jgi:hypothetical protein
MPGLLVLYGYDFYYDKLYIRGKSYAAAIMFLVLS